MIRPQTRLTFFFALTALPAALAVTVSSSWAPFTLGLPAFFFVLAAWDALRAGRDRRGLRADVTETIRLTKNREGLVPITLRRTGKTDAWVLRLGLQLPATIDTPREGFALRFPEGASSCRIAIPCTPRCRGNFPLNIVFIESLSPLGFWAFRRALPVNAELRSYPDLLPERRHLAALFLNREGFGIHAQRQIGQGREFEKLREYLPGDSFDDIHWRATAKRRRPITKQYQIERTQEIYVIVDAARLSLRQAPASGRADKHAAEPLSILETYIRGALVMGLVAERQGDLFGLVTFSDRIHSFIRARNGREHFHTCRDALYTLEGYSTTPDFIDLAAFLRTRLRRRALLLFLTNLDDPRIAEEFEQAMELLGRQHVVVAAMLKPAFAEPLFSRPVPDRTGIYEALSGHLTWESLRRLATALHRRGAVFTLFDRETLCPQLVGEYLRIKRRQVL